MTFAIVSEWRVVHWSNPGGVAWCWAVPLYVILTNYTAKCLATTAYQTEYGCWWCCRGSRDSNATTRQPISEITNHHRHYYYHHRLNRHHHIVVITIVTVVIIAFINLRYCCQHFYHHGLRQCPKTVRWSVTPPPPLDLLRFTKSAAMFQWKQHPHIAVHLSRINLNAWPVISTR